jgi:hypothetical protein
VGGAFKTSGGEHEKAILEESLALIRQHAKTNWLAAAWLLERKWPDKFALKNNVVREIAPDSKVIGDKLTESELLEIQERMTDFKRKNQNEPMHSPPTGESSAEPNPSTPEGEGTNQNLLTQ